MPASPRITKDDVEEEIERLRESGRRSFQILTEQVPDGFDPQRVGLVDIPQRQED